MPYPLWTSPGQLLKEVEIIDEGSHARIEISCCVDAENPYQEFIAYDSSHGNSERWPCRGDERRRKFTDCVELYYEQFRNGCGSPDCRTATCRTFLNRRNSDIPYRIPTQTTAKAMAVALASDDEPRKKLCPHISTASQPSAAAFADTLNVMSPMQKQEVFTLSAAKDAQRPAVSINNPVGTTARATSSQYGMGRNPGSGSELRSQMSRRFWEISNNARIDSKSFTQQLFDSLTWKYPNSYDAQDGMVRMTNRSRSSSPSAPVPGNEEREVFEDPPDPLITDSGLLRISTCAKHRELRSRAYLTRLDPEIIKSELSWVSLVQTHRNRDVEGSRGYHHSYFPFPPRGPRFAYAMKEDPNVGLDYCRRSVIYVLSTPNALKSSFKDERMLPQSSSQQLRTLSILDLRNCFIELAAFDTEPKFIFSSIWESLASAYLPPPYSSSFPNKSLGNSDRGTVSDHEAAHFVCIALGALTSSIPLNTSLSEHKHGLVILWQAFVVGKKLGRFIPPGYLGKLTSRYYLSLVWAFQDEQALRLMKRCLRVFSSRSFASGRATSSSSLSSEFVEHIIQCISSREEQHPRSENSFIPCSKIILEWARVILHQAWDGKAEFSWSTDTGSAIEFMRVLYENRDRLQLSKDDFSMPYLFKVMDFMEIPRVWVRSTPVKNHGHLLSFPWLFTQSAIVTYFRVINHSMMFKAVNASASMQALIARHKDFVTGHEEQIFGRLKTAMSHFLVLEIKRASILDDALNELWRRQRRELLRPLKIRMGMHEGEEGVDLGGIQQEFFRLALGEALDPKYGLFTVDETTHVAWFLPGSLTGRHHFTLIGVLVGLAIYNGVTLSVTFPLALYRKLLRYDVTTVDHIEDGWPVLCKGFRSMLDCPAAEVEDVFTRSYVFSAESNGTAVHFDMMKAVPDDAMPKPNSGVRDTSSPFGDKRLSTADEESHESGDVLEDAVMVTGENRDQYVKDYIFWLTGKSIRTQYKAFAEGFFMCMDRRALALFSPETLKELVEGFQDIDLAKLRKTTSYENGYSAQHPFIETFWRVVQRFSPQEVRKLLEFVTASDRIPAKGLQGLAFIIQRNGERDERLPTSLTCFGRLLLPQYSSEKVLDEKLRQAIENSLGFGVA